ncbi:MAG: extracellular solute-binding protein family 1 [Paenibacillus sp.]|jgi:multiple sugar transport system substrate-binding protein|nr:extracellular solute-binding protein family 1 [Paenibacillus sp.]
MGKKWMRIEWKRSGLLLGAAMLALLTACSASGSKKTDQAADDKIEKVDWDKEQAEVVFYSNNGDTVENFDIRVGNAVRKKFPNYTISYIQSVKGKSLPEMISSGTRFDIFFQSIGNYEANAFPLSIEYEMSDLIKKHGVDLSRFEPTIIDAIRQASGGGLFGLPIYTSNLVLFFNKSIFEKFGTSFPKNGMHWNDIMDLNKRLTRTDNGVQYFGFTHSPSHTIRMSPLSIPMANLATNKSTANRDDRWVKFLQTFFAEPFSLPGYNQFKAEKKNIPNNNTFNDDGTVAMYAYQTSYTTTLGRERKVDWDMVSLPTFPDLPSIGSQSYPSYFGITKMAKNKDAAMNVLKYMVSEEFQTSMARIGLLPVLKDDKIMAQLGADTDSKDKNWKAAYYNKLAPIPAKGVYDAALVTVLTKYSLEVALGTSDINTALRKAEEESNLKIEETLAQQK